MNKVCRKCQKEFKKRKHGKYKNMFCDICNLIEKKIDLQRKRVKILKKNKFERERIEKDHGFGPLVRNIIRINK